MTYFGVCLIAQLIIDAAFGWLYYDSITEGHGESISSFLYTWTRNWNHTHPFCGFVFPKEKVLTEWLWGWMSANDISKHLLQQCPGCKPGECKAVGIDACYVAVARSTLSGKQLFSVCVLLLCSVSIQCTCASHDVIRRHARRRASQVKPDTDLVLSNLLIDVYIARQFPTSARPFNRPSSKQPLVILSFMIN